MSLLDVIEQAVGVEYIINHTDIGIELIEYHHQEFYFNQSQQPNSNIISTIN